MASANLRTELECSICLHIYTDPVTLRCGHNFCRVCIDQFLNTQNGSGVYSCPECREEFQKRPELRRNITLCNVVENFLSTQPHQKEITEIRCTYCVDSPVPAVKSCLLCEASLCNKHLKVHSKSAEHVLTEPRTSVESRKCSVHQKILEYYCTEDAACICVSCCLIGQHQGHKMESLDEASEKKKEKLRNFLQKLTRRREKTEERVQSLEKRRTKAQEKSSVEVERVTALFIDIRRRLDDLEKRELNEISRQEERVSLSLTDVIQKLEVKKDELSRKMRHIEELCNMTDPLTVLQEPDTGDLCDPDEDIGGHDVGSKDMRGHDGGDEDTVGHNEGDDVTEGHNGGDEVIRGHDGRDEDTGGHNGCDEDTEGLYRPEEDTGRYDGGDEDTGGHDKTHDVDVITRMLHAGFSDLMAYLQTISSVKPKAMWPQPHSVRSPPSHTQDLPLSGTKYGGDDVIVRNRDVRGEVTATAWGGIYGKDPADILLDVNTAGNKTLISDNRKTVTWTEISQNRLETSERFQYHQVMSRRGFTSGKHSWDLEIGRSGVWRVGMCYPSIDRRGHQSVIGGNNKSWGLCGGRGYNDNQYAVIHDNELLRLPHQISSDRVRICLDYEAGRLSFYKLCVPIRHLHTFTASFTEPLHAVLRVWRGYINISGNSSCEEPSS
ncbi:E3 ubiquitin/ISG15 ligase TRIM25-like [Eleutherodactylus coqui]|uniref:E3 ubiquitin/ISG15 ligase TRIM25-like n=1 Tax=Eleutherodactylus coqui TaxID=57060 RepID=UPI0034633012